MIHFLCSVLGGQKQRKGVGTVQLLCFGDNLLIPGKFLFFLFWHENCYLMYYRGGVVSPHELFERWEMTSVKNFQVGLVLAVVFLVAANARADLSVNISDANDYKDGINLYQLFNGYFSEQLGAGGLYASSNDLYADRGVDPYTSWITSNSQVVGAFKVAAMGHTVSIVDSEGNNFGNLVNYGGTPGLGTGSITDLSGQSVVNIPDGLDVGFQLAADYNGKLYYTWSSNPDENIDGMAHMLAFNITDLYNAKHGTENDSVYMFAWEDLHLTGAGGPMAADWDYQDFVVIMTNVQLNDVTTPEPATLAILGLGLAGLGFARRRMMK